MGDPIRPVSGTKETFFGSDRQIAVGRPHIGRPGGFNTRKTERRGYDAGNDSLDAVD